MSDANIELGQMILNTLMGVGPLVVFSYRQSGFEPITFSGLIDRYPPSLTRVAAGDLRIRCPIGSFPGVVAFGPPDMVQEVESGVMYDVVASTTDFLGAARVFQIRRYSGLAVRQGTTQQSVVFSCESPVLEGAYVGGRFKWGYGVVLNSVSVVCSPPEVAAMQLTLEVNGLLTSKVVTIPVGVGGVDLDLGGFAVAGGVFVRWKCTGAPEPESSAAMVYLTMAYTL